FDGVSRTTVRWGARYPDCSYEVQAGWLLRPAQAYECSRVEYADPRPIRSERRRKGNLRSSPVSRRPDPLWKGFRSTGRAAFERPARQARIRHKRRRLALEIALP